MLFQYLATVFDAGPTIKQLFQNLVRTLEIKHFDGIIDSLPSNI